MTRDALRSARIERRPKCFVLLDTYKDHSRQVGTAPFKDDLTTLRSRITMGLELEPRFYRQDVDSTPDQLLDLLGVKHLHLGGQKSDVLVYLIEYESYVAVLEINDHKHFRTDPIGDLLRSHGSALAVLHRAEQERHRQSSAVDEAQRRRTRALAEARRRAGSARRAPGDD